MLSTCKEMNAVEKHKTQFSRFGHNNHMTAIIFLKYFFCPMKPHKGLVRIKFGYSLQVYAVKQFELSQIVT